MDRRTPRCGADGRGFAGRRRADPARDARAGRADPHRRVTSEAALRAALADEVPDIILSDFSMPGFSGQDALRIARELVPDTPFLFVSGTIGEELAIEACSAAPTTTC
jgi:CheY-like chemotaxis protein